MLKPLLSLSVLLMLSSASMAQTPKENPNVVNATPAGINLGFHNTANIAKSAKWLLNRFHKISIDSYASHIKPGSGANFILSFTAEGAMVTLADDAQGSGDAFSERGQFLPFRIQVNADGSKKIMVSAVGIRNGSQSSANYKGRLLDQLDILSLTWDQNSTFSNTKTFDLDIVAFKGKMRLSQLGQYSYLALVTGGSIGPHFQLNTDFLPAPYIEESNSLLRETYFGGLNATVSSPHGIQVKLETVFDGMHTNYYVKSPTVIQGTYQRNSRYWKNNLSVSKKVGGSSEPHVIGLEAEYNAGIHDAFKGDNLPTIEMLPYFKPTFVGKLFVSF